MPLLTLPLLDVRFFPPLLPCLPWCPFLVLTEELVAVSWDQPSCLQGLRTAAQLGTYSGSMTAALCSFRIMWNLGVICSLSLLRPALQPIQQVGCFQPEHMPELRTETHSQMLLILKLQMSAISYWKVVLTFSTILAAMACFIHQCCLSQFCDFGA